MHYVLAPFETGKAYLSLLNLNFTSKETNKEIWTPVFQFNILEPTPEIKYPLSLFPIFPEYQVALNVKNSNFLNSREYLEREENRIKTALLDHSFPWLFLLFVFIGSFVSIFVKFLKRQQIEFPKIEDPRTKALNRLKKFRNQKDLEKGRYDVFYEGIIQILKNFIEEKYLVFIAANTTDEFLKKLSCTYLPKDFYPLIQEVAFQADQVKFAHYEPTFEEGKLFYQRAKNLVELGELPEK